MWCETENAKWQLFNILADTLCHYAYIAACRHTMYIGYVNTSIHIFTDKKYVCHWYKQ